MNHAEKVKKLAAKACMDRFYAEPPNVVIDSQRIFEAAIDEMQAEIDRLRVALGEYANPDNWCEDESFVLRSWLQPGTTARKSYDGFSLAFKAMKSRTPSTR